MITDELYRAVRALVTCRGWSEAQAVTYLIDIGEERRRRLSRALKDWSIVDPADGPPQDDLEDRLRAFGDGLAAICHGAQADDPGQRAAAESADVDEPEDLGPSFRSHVDLVEAIESGDGERARTVMSAHMADASSRLEAALRRHEQVS